MKQNSLLTHLRDILILPVTVSSAVPYLIYDRFQNVIPEILFLKVTGIVLGLFGATLFFYTVFLFRSIGKGTLAPWSEKEKLVVAGPYKYCRNPMISGVLFILIGESLFFHSIAILLWASLFLLINTTYFILSEEPGLHKRFGADYEHYKRSVPRWIPSLHAYQTEVESGRESEKRKK
jgi:protein-S-isoprenylcysteine O-methyltransferase Ste14